MGQKTRTTGKIFPWITWFVAALFVLYQFLLQSSTSVMIPCLEVAFKIGADSVGFLSASFFYTYLVMQIPSGILIDRYGARRILTVAVAITAVASLIFARAHHVNTAEFSRLLMGFMSAPAVAATLYVAANWFPPKRFALIAGLTEMLGMLGGALGEAYLAHCVGSFGWRNTMLLCAAAGVVLAIITYVLVRDRPKTVVQPKHSEETHHTSVIKGLLLVMKRPQVWLTGLIAGFVFALVSAFAGFWAVPFLEVQYHLTLDKAALGASIIFLGIALGSPLLGWLSDQIGKRKPVIYVSTFICLVLTTISLYIPGMSIGLAFTLLFFVGVSVGSYVIPFAIVREITPALCRGTAMAFTNMMTILIGSPILQPLIGVLLKSQWSGKVVNGVQIFTVSNYHFALAVLPIMLFLALITLPFVKETYCEEC